MTNQTNGKRVVILDSHTISSQNIAKAIVNVALSIQVSERPWVAMNDNEKTHKRSRQIANKRRK